MAEIHSTHPALRTDPRRVWVVPFLAAAAIQVFAIERAGAASGPLLDLGNALAYACAVLLLWVMAPGAPPAPATAAPADPRWTDWLAGTPTLFRSPRFRTLTPGVSAMLLAGLLTGVAGAALTAGSQGTGRLAASAGLLVALEAGRFLLVWLVTVFLLCLSSVLVTGETDFRYMAALCGYGYLALPVAVYLALVYQFVFFPGADGSDPRVMMPAAVLLKMAEVWAVFAVARGFRWADAARPLPASRAMLVAALPFVVLAAARLGLRSVLG